MGLSTIVIGLLSVWAVSSTYNKFSSDIVIDYKFLFYSILNWNLWHDTQHNDIHYNESVYGIQTKGEDSTVDLLFKLAHFA